MPNEKYNNSSPVVIMQKEVLASLLKWGNDELNGEAYGVTENDFVTDVFREIFVKLKACNFNIGILVSEYAQRDMDVVRFVKDLHECAMACTSFPEYLTRLRELTSRTRLREKLHEVTLDPDISVELIQKIIDDEIKQTPCTSSENNADRYIENLKSTPELLFAKYGQIDSTTGGIRVPSLFIVGARPSTGKTTFAINTALRARSKVAMFSLEMNAEQIYNRMASIACRIPYSDILNRNLTDEQYAMITKFISDWKEWVTVIDDVYNIDNIAINIRKLKPKLAIVDYIQIVGSSSGGKEKSLRERMNDVSTELRMIAKQNNCCVLALSQITRGGKDKPRMSDLMESGALEANADYVMLMHRPYTVDKTDDSVTPEQTHIIIDKNRFGRTGVVHMSFDGKNQTFAEVDSHHE
jgi:replicative DNA helicase